MYDSRSRVQPPSHVTCQSPKREPIVTIWFPVACALTTAGQHIHGSAEGASQVKNLSGLCLGAGRASGPQTPVTALGRAPRVYPTVKCALYISPFRQPFF